MNTFVFPTTLRAGLVGLALWLGGGSASAQTPAPPDPAPRAPEEDSSVHLLGADPRQLRFEGETDSHVYPVFLTGNQANARARVHLSFTNAVSVMPEASRMRISVNDVLVAETPIASPASNDPSSLDLDIPAGLLEPGYNAIKLQVQQRHRVDCSLAATYELWTQIDPATTGLAFASLAPETIADVADLPALAPDESGATPIRIVVPQGVDVPYIERLFQALQAVVIRGRFTHPVIEVVSSPVDAPGLDLMVGTSDELRAAGLGDYLSDDQLVTLRAGGVPGHSIFVLSGMRATDVEGAIAALLKAAAEPMPGTPAGLRATALSGGTPVEGGSHLTLHDLGITSQEFSGRLFRAGFDLLLPPDFYAADYGKMTLRIDAGYVAGLDSSSQLLVRVNDRDAASLALPNPRGDVFRHRPITVSLTDLRPGFNHVQIEAQVAAPADKACDANVTLENRKRFVLLDASSVVLPSIARIAHMPSLAVTAASGFPYMARAGDTALYIPRPDAPTLGAAATFLARAALSAGAPLTTHLVLSKPALDKTSAIVIGALPDIPGPMIEAAGIDLAATREAWSHIEAKTAAYARLNEGDGSARAVKQAGAPSSDIGREEAALFRKWSDDVSSGHWQFDPAAIVSNLLHNTVGLSSANMSPWGRIETRYVPDIGARLLVAQHAAPGGGGATWTLVVAPSAELLLSGARELTSPETWNHLDGRVSALDPKTRKVVVVPASGGYFIQTSPLSPGNVRLIAAGWLSSYLEYYVLGLVALSLGLGLTTSAVVRRYGVKV